MEKIIIDFEHCKSTNEIRGLLKENLNLPEWNDKNPDDLLRILKELKSCKIYFRGINLIPDNLLTYMKQIIGIFDKVEDMYNEIRVYTWEIVTIDFNGVESAYEIHKRISEKLDFPEWYGGNLPALWDLLTGYISSFEIHLKGTSDVPEYLQPAMQQIIETFQEAEAEYEYHKIIVE